MPTTVLPRGRKTKLRLNWESVFATPVVGGWQELNTYTSDLQRSRALDADDVLGAGFNDNGGARPAAPGAEDASGKLTVPLDLLQIGWWLAAAMGRVSPTGTGPYTHSFAVGSGGLPSFSLEREFLAGAQYDGLLGGVIKSLKIPFKPGKGYNMVDIDLMGGQTLEPYAATAAGTPTVEALGARVPNSVGVIKIGGSQVGQIIDGAITLTNDLTADRYVGNSAFVSALIREGADVAVDITARYNTDALRAYGQVGGGFLPGAVSVEFDYGLGASSLTLVCPAVRFEPVNAPVSNGKSLTVALKGRAEVGAATPLLTATLVNTFNAQY